jgi:hypothetical protein
MQDDSYIQDDSHIQDDSYRGKGRYLIVHTCSDSPLKPQMTLTNTFPWADDREKYSKHFNTCQQKLELNNSQMSYVN